MVQEDNGATATDLLTQNHDVIPLGLPHNEVKITTHGQAYYNNTTNPTNTNATNENVNITLEAHKATIVAPITNTELCLVQTGVHKHMYPAVFHNGNYYTPGYLTGANQGTFLHKTRFDTYQKQQEDNSYIETKTTKTQQITEFSVLMRIPPEYVTVLKYGNEYLKEIGAIDYLTVRFEQLEKQPCKEYDPSGITREKSLEMCINHDQNVLNKKKHPKTEEQLKQEALGKEKQKDIQKNKKDKENSKKDISNTEGGKNEI